MAEPFIYLNTYTIRPGKLDVYEATSKRIIEVVKDNEPRMLYFAVHVDEDGSEATSIQIHDGADNMAYHMNVLQDHPELIEASREPVDFSSMSIQIFGTPTDAIVEQMRQMAGQGVTVTIRPPAAAFDRFAGG